MPIAPGKKGYPPRVALPNEDTVAERLDYRKISPEATRGLVELARYVRSGGLPAGLIELVKVRASQINASADCLRLHLSRARRFRVAQAQLDAIARWRDSPDFSARERAALAWTEALTPVADGRAPDSAWELVRGAFTDREIVDLSVAIVEINAWNRLELAFHRPSEQAREPSPPPRADPGPI